MKTLLFLIFPFIASAQTDKEIFAKLTKGDTVRIVMLVSDTSCVHNTLKYQDTRPYMTYGYQTSKGELLDAYKRKLGKNIVMWIAYKVN